MSSRFDNCMHYMHLHAMGACCPFPRSLKKLTRARSLASLSLGCPVVGWKVGMLASGISLIHIAFSQAPASPGADLQPMPRHAVAGCPRPPEGVEGLSAPHEERQPPQLTLRDMQVFARLLVAAQGRALALEAQTCETGDCQYGVISPPYRRACTVALAGQAFASSHVLRGLDSDTCNSTAVHLSNPTTLSGPFLQNCYTRHTHTRHTHTHT